MGFELPINICSIDPGLKGAVVFLTPSNGVSFYPMPLIDKDVDYDSVLALLLMEGPDHIFLERAVPMAMGAKHAFNYGRGFMALELAVKHSKIPVTYVEPAKWTKAMHEGISSDLKPKAKSVIALKRLQPDIFEKVPKAKKTEKPDEGVVDGVLIALFGRRLLNIA